MICGLNLFAFNSNSILYLTAWSYSSNRFVLNTITVNLLISVTLNLLFRVCWFNTKSIDQINRPGCQCRIKNILLIRLLWSMHDTCTVFDHWPIQIVKQLLCGRSWHGPLFSGNDLCSLDVKQWYCPLEIKLLHENCIWWGILILVIGSEASGWCAYRRRS